MRSTFPSMRSTFRGTLRPLAAAAAVGSLLLAACGSSSTTPSATGSKKGTTAQPVTITLSGWTSSPVEAQLMTTMLGQFESTHPNIHVLYRPIPGSSGSSYSAAIRTRIAAGNAPDVIYVNNGGEASSFIADGVLRPLNAFMAAAHVSTSDFYPEALAMFEHNGTVYGLPKDQSPLALFYNKTLFQRAGIAGPPATWAQFEADAKALTDPAIHQYGLINSAQEPRWAEFLTQAGGGVMNASMSRMTLTSPASITGYEFYVNLYRKGYATLPTTVGASWGGQAFGMGKAGMVLSGDWLVPFLSQTYPHVKFGIAELPKGPANNESLAFPVAYGIPATAPHPRAAFTLISYLTSEPGMTKWMNLGLALPTRPDLIGIPYYSEHPVLHGLLSQLPDSIPWNFPKGFGELSSVTMTNETTLAIEGRISPVQALTAMQKAGMAVLASGS